jgi:predicted GIY-YIG superfamily endonuclease
MYYLYILKMSDGRLYVGITDDLKRRESQHKQGDLSTRTTRIFGAGPMLYHEVFPDRSSALKRERQIKKWSRSKKTALIEGDGAGLKRLAKRRVRGNPL